MTLALVMSLLTVPAATAEAPPPGGVSPVAVGPEVPVTPVDLRIGHANNSPMVVADPSRPQMLALANRVDGPDFSCSLHVSTDGGGLWAPARPVPQLPPGAEKCYGPEVAFDRQGTLYYLFVGLQGRGNTPMGAFLATSADGGRTFSPPRPVLGANSFQVRMAVDTTVGSMGRLHLVWVQASGNPSVGSMPPPPNPILSAYSDDGGETFSAPVQVNDSSRRRVMAPALALGPDQSVHVLYYDLQDDAVDYQGLEGPVWEGTWSLVLATSRDGGGGYGPNQLVDDEVVPPERVMLIFTMAPPTLAVDPTGRVFAAWHDGRNGDWDVFLRRSDDGGHSWAAPMRLNDDPLGNGRHQYLPRLSVAPDGRLDAIFYDRRDDPENLRNHVSYTFAADGGRDFAPNVSLTRESSHSMVGQRYPLPSAEGQVEFGSRLALLSAGSSAVAAWTDTRNVVGGAGPDAGPITQDVFATRVDIEPGGSGPIWPVLAAVAAVLVAVVVAMGMARRRRPRGDGDLAGALSAARLRMPRRRWRPGPVSMLTAGLSLVATSCGAGASALPVNAEVFDVTMDDHSFEYEAAPTAGRVVLRAHNLGSVEHDLTLTLLPDDFPLTIDEQLRSETRRAFPALGSLPPRAPGQTGTFAVDLPPGRYALICFVKDPSGELHGRLGMSTEFRIR